MSHLYLVVAGIFLINVEFLLFSFWSISDQLHEESAAADITGGREDASNNQLSRYELLVQHA